MQLSWYFLFLFYDHLFIELLLKLAYITGLASRSALLLFLLERGRAIGIISACIWIDRVRRNEDLDETG